MNLSVVKLSLLAAALLSPAIAHADTFSTFTFTETFTNVAPTQSVSFTVDTTPGAVNTLLHFSGDEFDFYLPTSANSSDLLQFYDNSDGGGICTDEFCSDVDAVPQLFTGTVTSPTFITMTTPTVFDDAQANVYSMTITQSTVGATPEPSSFVLLGTGVLGIAGVARRRFAAKLA